MPGLCHNVTKWTLLGKMSRVAGPLLGGQGPRSSRMRTDTLCVVTHFSLHSVTVKRSRVVLRICVKPLRVREDLGPRGFVSPWAVCFVPSVNLLEFFENLCWMRRVNNRGRLIDFKGSCNREWVRSRSDQIRLIIIIFTDCFLLRCAICVALFFSVWKLIEGEFQRDTKYSFLVIRVRSSKLLLNRTERNK